MVTLSDSGKAVPNSIWVRLDDAWDFGFSSAFKAPERLDASTAGPSLRFITRARTIEAFYSEYQTQFRPFTLSGSGDFHHLTAVFIRQFREPLVVVSFDNHPDWDIRPPYWSCGAWINRALENPSIRQVAVWGCGSFECHLPWRLLGNRAACRIGRLRVAPWQKEGSGHPEWLRPITSETWQTEFCRYVETLRLLPVYITVDLDCLREQDAVTNWENGRFTVPDIVWAIRLLRRNTKVIGGDLCGAISTSRYGSRFQALAGKFDHPRPRLTGEATRRTTNLRALEEIWPCLAGESDS